MLGRVKVFKGFVTVVFVILVLALVACGGVSEESKTGEEGLSSMTENEQMSQTEWSIDADCGLCHVDEKDSYTSAACLASAHQDILCVSCHDNQASMAEVHEGKTVGDKVPNKLKQTEVGGTTCLSCHYETLENLAIATPDIPDAIDDNKTTINPHEAMLMPQHQTEEDRILCGDCHKMHKDKTAEKAMSLACTSCHHAGVFECYTCHE